MTETKTHWRKQAALDEAERWQELNQGWSQGLPAELPGVRVKGNVPVVRETQKSNGYEGTGLPWWRLQGNLAKPRTDAANLPLSWRQLATRKAWAAATPVATLERMKPLPCVKRVTVTERLPKHLLEGLTKPTQLKETTLTVQAQLQRDARLKALAALAAAENEAWANGGPEPSWLVNYRANLKKKTTREELRLQKATAQQSLSWTSTQVALVASQANSHLRPVSLEKCQEDAEDTWEEELPEKLDPGLHELSQWVRNQLTQSQLDQLNQETPRRTETLLARALRKEKLAEAELAEWAEARLTAKQLNALTTDDLSDSTTRVHRHQARQKLQELPGHLRLRR